MELKVTTTSSSATTGVAASIEAKGSAIGVDAGGSASIESFVSNSEEVTSSKTSVRIRGGDRGADIVKSMDIKNASDTILNFANQAKEGTILSYEIHSFQNHPDYTRTLSCC